MNTNNTNSIDINIVNNIQENIHKMFNISIEPESKTAYTTVLIDPQLCEIRPHHIDEDLDKIHNMLHQSRIQTNTGIVYVNCVYKIVSKYPNIMDGEKIIPITCNSQKLYLSIIDDCVTRSKRYRLLINVVILSNNAD